MKRVVFALMLLVVFSMMIACTSQFQRGQLVALENPDAVVMGILGDNDSFLVIYPDGRIVVAHYVIGGGSVPVLYQPSYQQPTIGLSPYPCP